MSSLDALADPVRLRIVRRLAEGGAATLHELADAAGVHLNTARAHVSALEDAGQLVRESGVRRGRGRPRTRYRLAEGWIPPTGDYRALAELLGTALVRSGAQPADVRAVGLEWGRWLLGRPGDHDLRRELPRALERLGFHAEMDRHVLSLSACPCALVAPDRPRLVCELAIAVSDGVLARAGSSLRVGWRSHDPGRRSCQVRLERVEPARP